MGKRSLNQDIYLVSCILACTIAGGFVSVLVSNWILQTQDTFNPPALLTALLSWVVASIMLSFLFHKHSHPQLSQILKRYVFSCFTAAIPVALLYGLYTSSGFAPVAVSPTLVVAFFIPFSLLMGLSSGLMFWLLYGLR